MITGENLLPLIVQLVSSAVGGNLAGAALKNLSLGTVLSSMVGIPGGGLGGQLLGMLGISTGSGELDLGGIVGSVAGGAVLLAIVGAVKKALAK